MKTPGRVVAVILLAYSCGGCSNFYRDYDASVSLRAMKPIKALSKELPQKTPEELIGLLYLAPSADKIAAHFSRIANTPSPAPGSSQENKDRDARIAARNLEAGWANRLIAHELYLRGEQARPVLLQHTNDDRWLDLGYNSDGYPIRVMDVCNDVLANLDRSTPEQTNGKGHL
jgi:hypothetical protein